MVRGGPITGDMPYLSTALYALVAVPTDDVATMATDPAWRLYVNPHGWPMPGAPPRRWAPSWPTTSGTCSPTTPDEPVTWASGGRPRGPGGLQPISPSTRWLAGWPSGRADRARPWRSRAPGIVGSARAGRGAGRAGAGSGRRVPPSRPGAGSRRPPPADRRRRAWSARRASRRGVLRDAHRTAGRRTRTPTTTRPGIPRAPLDPPSDRRPACRRGLRAPRRTRRPAVPRLHHRASMTAPTPPADPAATGAPRLRAAGAR